MRSVRLFPSVFLFLFLRHSCVCIVFKVLKRENKINADNLFGRNLLIICRLKNYEKEIRCKGFISDFPGPPICILRTEILVIV